MRRCGAVLLITSRAELVGQGPGVPAGYQPETSESGSERSGTHSAPQSNLRRERTEVSRGRSSRGCNAVKGRTGMDKEEP